jgi:hypothetical protein
VISWHVLIVVLLDLIVHFVCYAGDVIRQKCDIFLQRIDLSFSTVSRLSRWTYIMSV